MIITPGDCLTKGFGEYSIRCVSLLLNDMYDTSFQSQSGEIVEQRLVSLVGQETTITSMNFRNPRVIVSDIAIAFIVLTGVTNMTL